MERKVIIIVWLCLMAIAANAQPRFEQGEGRTQNPAISYEVVTMFGGDTSQQLVKVHYRISQSFFIFVRNETAAPKAEYVGRGELVVELLNEQKISAAREIRQLPLSRTTLPREGERMAAMQGTMSFLVSPGAYTVVFNLDDRESGRSFIEKTRKIRVPALTKDGMEFSSPILVQTSLSEKTPIVFVPANRGGNTLFGEPGGIVTELYQPQPDQAPQVRWKLRGILDGFGERQQFFQDSSVSIQNGLLTAMPQEGGISYSLRSAPQPWQTFFIPLPLQHLEPGLFTLDIEYRFGGVSKQQQYQFSVVWPSRPFSLTDQDLAIDAARHIASDQELDGMISGGATKRAEAFARFWRNRSRDTTTAFNDVMAEYYYRVDDALRKFSTARDNDGYKTDRGRIYILYGPPQRSERSLQPSSAPTEVWTYERLRKRFIFIDTGKNGTYILSQTENL